MQFEEDVDKEPDDASLAPIEEDDEFLEDDLGLEDDILADEEEEDDEVPTDLEVI